MPPHLFAAPSSPGCDSLLAALKQVFLSLPAGSAVGVAVSGGPDSFALAALAAQVAGEQGHALHLLHVHHGLQAMADAWADQVRALAAALHVNCDVRRVEVACDQGDGIEAAARAARYQALGDMAGRASIRHVLLGHHLDDQAETVLLRLLRGAGPEGMGAMAASTERGGVTYLRPWLDIERARIAAVAQSLAGELGLALADDPTNMDARYARGALRSRVLPAIAGHWPGYRATLSRYARLASNAAEVLAEVAKADLQSVLQVHPAHGETVNIPVWRELSAARRAMALRAWLARQGVAMPSEARLAQMCEQLLRAAPDRQVLLRHDGVQVRSYRNRVMLDRARTVVAKDAAASSATDEPAPLSTIHWQGEPSIYLPELAGTLYFDQVQHGLDPQWLLAQPLRVGLRRGRERLRPNSLGPSRSLKNLYQEAGIPAWERARLPLVWRGSVLLFAAGLGLDARAVLAPDGVMLRWHSDSPGATISRPHDKPPPNAG